MRVHESMSTLRNAMLKMRMSTPQAEKYNIMQTDLFLRIIEYIFDGFGGLLLFITATGRTRFQKKTFVSYFKHKMLFREYLIRVWLSSLENDNN